MDLLRLKTPVEFTSKRTVAECEAALRRVSKPPLTFGNTLFVGRVEGGRGRLWFRKRLLWNSARSLVFELLETPEGCKLVGHLELVAPLRYFVLSYWAFCIAGMLWGVILILGRHLSPRSFLLNFLTYPVLCMIGFFLYAEMCQHMGQRVERLGQKLIKHIVASPESERIALDILN